MPTWNLWRHRRRRAPSFPYDELPEGFIRLLTIDDSRARTLKCSLSTHRLDNQLQYNALSYTWGDDAEPVLIKCKPPNSSNAVPLSIKSNLLAALRQIGSTTDLPLWVDAICINQAADTDAAKEDKAAQVSRMGQVYQLATSVIVWLGPAADDSDLAMDAVEFLASPDIEGYDSSISNDQGQQITIRPLKDVLSRGKWVSITGTIFKDLDLPSHNDPLWGALGYLYSRPWMSRLWTYQEVLLARACDVRCGNRTVAWKGFFDCCNMLLETGLMQYCLLLAPGASSNEQGTAPLWSFKYPHQHDGLYFFAHLAEARRRLCTLEVDKIYGVLGVAPAAIRDQIVIDYSKEWTHVYTTAARAILASWDSGYPLLAYTTSVDRSPNLPSWCPDFRQMSDTLAMSNEAEAGYDLGYEKGFQSPSRQDSISIFGAKIDVVAETVATYECKWSRESTKVVGSNGLAAQMLRWFDDCWELALQTCHGDAEIAFEAYWKTLLTDVASVGQPFYHADLDVLVSGRLFREDLQLWSQTAADRTEELSVKQSNEQQIQPLFNRLQTVWKNRVLFATKGGRLGVAHKTTRPGDEVYAFFGGSDLYVVRKYQRPVCQDPAKFDHYQYISNAFVQGLMQGEAKAVIKEPVWLPLC